MKAINRKVNRKEFLAVTAGLAATALVSRLGAAEADHEHHHNHQGAAKNAALIAAAADCMAKAEVCVNHCIISLRSKDLSLVECLASVREMIPLCNTLGALAAYESKQLAAFAKICISACTDCMKECEKHAKTHKACADCAESCKTCIAECKKVA